MEDGLWHEAASPLFTKRAGHSATAWREKVFVIGGRQDSGCVADVLCYDTRARSWTRLGAAPFSPRAHHTATLVPSSPLCGEDEVWVVGGSDEKEVFGDAHAFTPATGAWRRCAVSGAGAPSLARTAHGAALSPSPAHPRSILLHGGCALYAGAYRGDLVRLSCDSGQAVLVTPCGVPPQPRGYHALAALGHYLLVFGGRTDQQVEREIARGSQAMALYDAVADRWLPTRPLGVEPATRCNAAVCSLPAPGGGPPCALLLHGGNGIASGGRSVRRLADAHILRAAPGRAGNVFSWEALGECGPAGVSMHAVAACASTGAAGGWRLLLCGGIGLETPMARWLPPPGAAAAAAPSQALLARQLSQPPPAPAGAAAASQGEEPGGWMASKGGKRAREAAPAATAAPSGRPPLALAPSAEVRAAEAASRRAEAAEAAVAALREELEAGRAAAARVSASLAESDVARRTAERDAASARAAAATAEARCAAVLRDCEEARAALRAEEGRGAAAEAALRPLRASEARARAEAEAGAREAATVRAELAGAREAARAAADAGRAALEAEMGKSRAAEAAAAAALRASETRSAELAALRSSQVREAATARAAADEAAGRLASLVQERNGLSTELSNEREAAGRVRAELRAALREKDDGAAALRAADGALAEARGQLIAARAAAVRSEQLASQLQGEMRRGLSQLVAAQQTADQLASLGGGGVGVGGGGGGSAWGR